MLGLNSGPGIKSKKTNCLVVQAERIRLHNEEKNLEAYELKKKKKAEIRNLGSIKFLQIISTMAIQTATTWSQIFRSPNTNCYNI